jgi:hypothetical protein
LIEEIVYGSGDLVDLLQALAMSGLAGQVLSFSVVFEATWAGMWRSP